ncbi:HVA22-like protein k isoform X3 [Magnolia sinica]|uniref:HVA22-like protein k isoform X3 n=1 Tax=Magnolia sinica TaxID=86752 RepID=UPI0026593D02|nr:HVA22-like protein k isoform X3 [Magnolia sinica]
MVNAAALLGSTITGEIQSLQVGLRLLLCPLGSNVVIRTACCTVGIVLPVYSTFKAIERKDQSEQERWLVYWAAYGSFSLAEVFSDKILSWFPPYYYVKFAFLVWLQFPPADAKFVSAHQAEIQFVRALLGRFFIAAHQMVKDVIQPVQPPGRAAIEGPRRQQRRQIEDSESDHDD